MDRRGRSRDVSPIALARTAQRTAFATALNHMSPPPTRALVADPPHPPFFTDSCAVTRATQPPLASSSKITLPPPPPPHVVAPSSPPRTIPRTLSSDSIISLSPPSTPPEPLTPPDYGFEHPLEYYDSPPSPPRTLQDQMQVAYALDNMQLAKILFLKLKGVEVDGDDDPRIASVRDEDFASSFVPAGGLVLDEECERRVREAERRAREVQKRRAREQRLMLCERKWERSARWIREEKRRKEEAIALERRRQKEADAKKRERARMREAARQQPQHPVRPQLRIVSGNPRPVLCYDSLRNNDKRFPNPSPQPPAEEPRFLYTIRPSTQSTSRPSSLSPLSASPTDKEELSLPRACREMALQHARNTSRTVPFSDVLTSMHGPLFPVDDYNTKCYAPRTERQLELLESLFESDDGPSKDEDGFPQRKVARASRLTRSLTSDSTSSASETSSSSSANTRAGSWFSFRSSRSRSTVLTTPSTSPLKPLKSPSDSPSISSIPLWVSALRPRRTHAKVPRTSPVSIIDHPLAPPPSSPLLKSKAAISIGRGRALTRQPAHTGGPGDHHVDVPTGLVHRVSRSVSTFIDLAAQLQRAYIKATITTAGMDFYTGSRPGSRSVSPRPRVRCTSVPVRGPSGATLRPSGYRVCCTDVSVFTAAAADGALADAPQLQRTLIPLLCPAADGLPSHTRVFPLPPPLPRSPYRPAYPPSTRLSRLRPVANPIILRLQALQNVCSMRALRWEGRAVEGRMVQGREKMLGIAWEGIGRSGLGWGFSAAR